MKRANRRALVLAAAAALAGGCGEETPTGPERIEALPRELSSAEVAAIDVANAFGFDLLREAAADDPAENVFLSPLSASMALGMALAGAEGDTREEMRAALRLDALADEEIGDAYASVLDLLVSLDDRIELEVANSAWLRSGFSLLPAYVSALSENFDAEARELDFDDPNARTTINAWVNTRTRGRITGIIDEIRSDDVLFLLNAVYFKGEWTTRFDPSRTGPAAFRLADGSSVDVSTMHARKMPVRIAHDDGVLIGELPYGGGAFGMVVALPPGGTPLGELIARLDAPTWERWMAALSMEEEAPVSLPKLSLTYDEQLQPMLERFGMKIAFTDAADFSRMTPTRVLISEVRQKTFLEVDEVGTEAAAVTSVGVALTSAPPALIVDRPFLIAIRERFSGAIVFAGAIRDPR